MKAIDILIGLSITAAKAEADMALRAAGKQPTSKTARTETLTENWPMAFNPEQPKPLAVGIQAELFKTLPEGVSKKSIRKAMRAWCQSKAYHRAMLAAGEGQHRIGLDGQPVAGRAGYISADHIEAAKKQETI